MCDGVRCANGGMCDRGFCVCPPSCPTLDEAWTETGSVGHQVSLTANPVGARLWTSQLSLTTKSPGFSLTSKWDTWRWPAVNWVSGSVGQWVSRPTLDEPICANDSVTYQNICMMRSAACNVGVELRAIYPGECRDVTHVTSSSWRHTRDARCVRIYNWPTVHSWHLLPKPCSRPLVCYHFVNEANVSINDVALGSNSVTR